MEESLSPAVIHGISCERAQTEETHLEAPLAARLFLAIATMMYEKLVAQAVVE